MTFYPLTEDDRELIAIAQEKIGGLFDEKSYLHTVGAAVRCRDGKVYSGVNVDGIHGSCAEYIAIGVAVSDGRRDFDTIVAVHRDHPNGVISPCGNCRQMLLECCPDIKVILNDDRNRLVKVGVRELLPFACL